MARKTLMQAYNLDILKKKLKVEKTQNSRKKLKVLANFDNEVTKYLSNGHKNPSFSLYYVVRYNSKLN